MSRVARLDYERKPPSNIDRIATLLIVLTATSLMLLPLKVSAQSAQGATITTKQIYAGGMLIATVETKGGKSTVRYVHPDALNSTDAVTDANGNLVEDADYYPYGGVRVDDTSASFSEPKKYIGQYDDSATNLDYLNARYYDPQKGKFASEDPVFLATPAKQNLQDPQTLNSYSYASDNPITKSDPSGQLTIVVPGTSWNWDTPETMCTPGNIPLPFLSAVGKTFHETPVPLDWSGKDTSDARTEAAMALVNIVNDHEFRDDEKLNIVGYSHGGNVAIQASTMDVHHAIDNLVTIGTPVRPDYKPNEDVVHTHINAYSAFDAVQGLLGGNIGIYYPEVGPAGRTYSDAQNINVMYETSFRPLQSHYNLPNENVWERVDAVLRADGTN